ncbi:MAG: hypothetical protein U9N83_01660 [Thermodesulfobacteriota bacterium]|nr:hypothetical protein [Thermodesulfobacteriota bacterium]
MKRKKGFTFMEHIQFYIMSGIISSTLVQKCVVFTQSKVNQCEALRKHLRR